MFKSYPVCSAAQAGAELTMLLMKRHNLTTDDIEKVICEVPLLVDISLIYNHPKSIREAQFSMPFAVGCMLAFGKMGLAQLTDEVLMNTKLQQQIKKVTMYVPEYLANDPIVLQQCPEAAGVTLITKDQVEFKDFLARPTGMPGNPISTTDLLTKFMICAAYGSLSQSTAESMSLRTLSMEEELDVRQLYLS